MSDSSVEVFLIAALSADGFIAREASELSTAWTSPEDKKRLVSLTKQAGVVVMGRKTFETFGSRPLKDRTLFIYSRQLSTRSLPQADGVVWTALDPAQLVAEVGQRGFRQLAVCGGAEVYTQFLLAGLVKKLYLTIEPVLFGRGINLFNTLLDIRLDLLHSHTTPGGTQFLDFEVKP